MIIFHYPVFTVTLEGPVSGGKVECLLHLTACVEAAGPLYPPTRGTDQSSGVNTIIDCKELMKHFDSFIDQDEDSDPFSAYFSKW